jgi:hypothetical protein
MSGESDTTANFDAAELDVLGHLRRHLAGPLTGGFEIDELVKTQKGWVVGPLRNASVHVVLGQSLDEVAVTLEVTASFPDGENEVKRTIVFESFSDRGTALPIFVPADGDLPADTRITIHPSPEDLNVSVHLRQVKGNFAHLVYLSQLETARIRRSMRMLARHRLLSSATGRSLDGIGADLSIPRLDSVLRFNFDRPQTRKELESDTDYRKRLAPFRQFVVPTRENLEQTLETVGLGDKITVHESDRPLDAVVRIIEVNVPPEGNAPAQTAPLRDAYFEAIKRNVLIDPHGPIPDRIREPEASRHENEIRDRLRERLGDSLISPQPMTPALAEALLRILDLCASLRVPRPFEVMQTMKEGAGNGGTDERLELAVGADLNVSRDAVAALGAALDDIPSDLTGAQRRIAETAAAKVSAGAGVFEAVALAAGIAVCLPADDSFTFVSTMHYGGVLALGPNLVTAANQRFQVVDPYPKAFGQALSEAATEVGIPEAILQSSADLTALAGELSTHGVGFEHLAELGFATADDRKLAVALEEAKQHRLEGLRMPASMTLNVVEGVDDEIVQLVTIMGKLADRGVAGGALTRLRSDEILLVVGPNGVPPLGANLTGRVSFEARWYLVPLSGSVPSGSARLIGRGTELVLPSLPNGLYALVAVAYRRVVGFADPYEIAIRPVPGETLGFDQFELLVNLLSRFRPAGVEINTWRLRKAAVRFDPDYKYAPPSVLSERGIRKYRVPRISG